MKEYQGFPISNARTGFDEALEPWLIPRDGYQVLNNAHLYRGVVEKINGYDLFAKMSYRTTVGMTGAINGINQTYTVTLATALTSNSFIAQGTTNGGATAIETFIYLSDFSSTVLTLVGSAGGTGTIDITNPNAPIVTVIFNTAPPSIMPGAVQYNAVTFTYDSYPTQTAIMGIRPYFMSNGGQEILIFDRKRAGKIVAITSADVGEYLDANNAVQEIPHQVTAANIAHAPAFNGVTTVFTGTITGPLYPGTVQIKLFTNVPALVETYTDNGKGLLSDVGGVARGFINYLTGQWQLTFAIAPVVTDTLNSSVCQYGDTFSGTISDFFVVANYKNNAFITNNNDAIRYYDGTCLMYLNTNITTTVAVNVITYAISKCLHVEVYRERLLLIAPTVSGTPQLNDIYWSEAQVPTNFTGGFHLPASTSEPIKTFKIINTDMIVRFSNSERVFRYTADAFSPFRWDSTNIIWRCDAPYSAINYDTYFTSVGKPAIVGSDGVNVKRADEIIPDFTDPYRIDNQQPALFLDQTNIKQCYGERFDDLKEGWMCYRSSPSNTTVASDTVLAFNYLDETYATYTFPFSCLGYGSVINVPTWGNDYREWISIEDTWGSFALTVGSLVDLAGDQFGNVYQLDTAYTTGAMKDGVITGASRAAACVVTSVAHGLNSGDQIIIQDVLGMTIINNDVVVVTVLTADTFSIPIDTSLANLYTSGGVWFTAPVMLNIVSKDFNPFVEQGQLARFGYLDLLVSSNENTTIRVQFYKDNELDADYTGSYQETSITFTGGQQSKVWKRIYVGCTGKAHTIRFYQDPQDFDKDTLNQPFKLHCMVPYFKPAGRIYN